jgi:hypothetical protein
LNRSATSIPSACRIASITDKDAMILPYDANPCRMEFSERTPAFGSKTPTVVIMAGKIPASDFVAFVDAVEQRRAMEEYGNADWMIHAVN